jgi:hypothetical protein
MLRAQINTGLAPVQDAFSQSWNGASPVLTQNEGDERAIRVGDVDVETAPAECRSTSSLSTLLAALQNFERSREYGTAPSAVQTLTKALVQQLHVALRNAKPESQSQSTVQFQFEDKGVNNNG